MKKRSKKGMALASTLLMMTIIMMLSALMMTVTLYGSRVVGLQTQNVQDRRVLDDIGNRFLKNKENPDAALKYIKENNSGMKYVDSEGNEISELGINKKIKGTMEGIEISISVVETDNNCKLTVCNAKGRQLMKIVCEKSTDARTGEVTTQLKSWAYAG